MKMKEKEKKKKEEIKRNRKFKKDSGFRLIEAAIVNNILYTLLLIILAIRSNWIAFLWLSQATMDIIFSGLLILLVIITA